MQLIEAPSPLDAKKFPRRARSVISTRPRTAPFESSALTGVVTLLPLYSHRYGPSAKPSTTVPERTPVQLPVSVPLVRTLNLAFAGFFNTRVGTANVSLPRQLYRRASCPFSFGHSIDQLAMPLPLSVNAIFRAVASGAGVAAGTATPRQARPAATAASRLRAMWGTGRCMLRSSVRRERPARHASAGRRAGR